MHRQHGPTVSFLLEADPSHSNSLNHFEGVEKLGTLHGRKLEDEFLCKFLVHHTSCFLELHREFSAVVLVQSTTKV